MLYNFQWKKKKNTWQAEKSEGEKDSSSTYRP